MSGLVLVALLSLAGTEAVPAAEPVQPVAASVPAPATSPAATDQPATPTIPAAAPPPAVRAADPGDIVVTARRGPPPGDPVEKINTVSFEAMQGVDKAFVGPIATVYQKGVPEPLRDGLHNAMNNLSEPINFVNYLLQLKPGKALRTLGRFTINTTVGVGGLFDVAKRKPFKLAYRRNGFANTFGYYGIGNGPYLFLPLIGPTTVRDLTGRLLDLSLLPTVVRGPFKSPYYSIGTGVIRSLDDRVEFDDTLRKLREECPDSYASERQWYLATREADIADLHGRHVDVVALLPECLQPEVPPPPPVPIAPAPAAPPVDQPAVTPQM